MARFLVSLEAEEQEPEQMVPAKLELQQVVLELSELSLLAAVVFSDVVCGLSPPPAPREIPQTQEKIGRVTISGPADQCHSRCVHANAVVPPSAGVVDVCDWGCSNRMAVAVESRQCGGVEGWIW